MSKRSSSRISPADAALSPQNHRRSAPRPQLDSFDLAILSRYQHDTRLPAAKIGALVGLSAAAVQRRLKRLRETGVIQAEIAMLDPEPLGLPLTVIVHVDLTHESSEYIETFARSITARPAVQQCWHTTGATDFILVVRTASMKDFDHFTRTAFGSNVNIKSFTSYVALSSVKSGLSLPI